MGEHEKIPYQYLVYDFTYKGKRHKEKVLLEEDIPILYMLYDDHAIEVTWVKRIRHKGKYVELIIVVNADPERMPMKEKLLHLLGYASIR